MIPNDLVLVAVPDPSRSSKTVPKSRGRSGAGPAGGRGPPVRCDLDHI